MPRDDRSFHDTTTEPGGVGMASVSEYSPQGWSRDPAIVPWGTFIGQAPKIQEILDLVARVADTDATVLITGESGTAKEFIARALHEGSRRRGSRYVAVNSG